MADKLMPCPFCGGEKLSIQSDHFGATWISCDSCNARGPAPGRGERDVEVIALWNKRQSLHVLAKALEEEANDIEKHAPFAGTAIREARAQGKTMALREVAKRLRGKS